MVSTRRRRVLSYRDLEVWQAGMDLVTECYRLSQSLPADERFGLTAQLRRSAVSVPANVAEGYGRRNTADYLRFLLIANGSLKELETHLLVCERLGLLPGANTEPALAAADRLGRMLAGLIRALKRPPPPKT